MVESELGAQLAIPERLLRIRLEKNPKEALGFTSK